MKRGQILLVAIILVLTLIVLLIKPTKQIILNDYHPIHQISKKFNPKNNIKKVIGGSIDDVIVDTSKIDFTKVGQYPLIYEYNHIKTTIMINLVDTTIPDIKVKEVTIDLGMKVIPEDFVSNIYNKTKVSIKFKEDYHFDEVKDYAVELIINYNNQTITKKSIVHVLPRDELPPKIMGVRNLTVLKNSEIDLLSSVIVKDNQDNNPTLMIDSSSLDVSKIGDYQITYLAKDRSLNQCKETCIVSVVENIKIGSFKPSKQKIVYLTFDDGPSVNTAKMLAILAKYNAKATFFVTGTNEEYFHLIKQASDEGHTIGLHSYVHEYDQIYRTPAAYFNDLKQIEDLVYQQTGHMSKYVRFPGGSSNQVSKQYCNNIMAKLTKEILNRGYQYYDWNSDSKDGSGTLSVKQLVENATTSNENNIVILFHDANGKENSLKAVEQVIIHYQQRGYVFKAINDQSFVVHHTINN